jgi:hypothetical protein
LAKVESEVPEAMKTERLLGLLCVVALTACGGNNNNTKADPSSLSGNWQISLQSTISSDSESQSGFLVQSGNILSGSLLFSGQTISGQTACAGVGSATGQVSGSEMTLTVSPAGQTISLTGASGNSGSLSGNYSILAAGCGQSDTGTWTASLVQPLSGVFVATFTPYYGEGNIFHFTGSITQGPNSRQSIATLSGTMTSTDAPCFSTISVAGIVTGTAVTLNFLTADGQELGKYAATMTTDASSLSGNFAFTDAANPGALGGCQPFGGDATVTVQTSSSGTN